MIRRLRGHPQEAEGKGGRRQHGDSGGDNGVTMSATTAATSASVSGPRPRSRGASSARKAAGAGVEPVRAGIGKRGRREGADEGGGVPQDVDRDARRKEGESGRFRSLLLVTDGHCGGLIDHELGGAEPAQPGRLQQRREPEPVQSVARSQQRCSRSGGHPVPGERDECVLTCAAEHQQGQGAGLQDGETRGDSDRPERQSVGGRRQRDADCIPMDPAPHRLRRITCHGRSRYGQLFAGVGGGVTSQEQAEAAMMTLSGSRCRSCG